MVADRVRFPTLSFLRTRITRGRPVYVHYAVTSRCNLRCRSCVIWQRETANELTLDDVDELAALLVDLGCVQVSLGGGEPALRDDLPGIVKAFQSRGIRTRVLTNGVALTPTVARQLLEVGLTEVSFSLDSLDRAVQENMDNTPGAFDKRIRNLVELARLLPARGSLPILNTVVTPENFRQLPEIAGLAADLGFHASFIPIHHPPCAEDEHRFYGEAPELRFGDGSGEQLRAVFRQLIELKRRGGPIVNSSAFLEQTPDYLLTGRASWPCRAGELFLSVSPEGKVAPCHAFEGEWEVNFRELGGVLGSPDYRAELEDRLAGCEGCFRPCWAEVSFMMLQARALLEMVRVQARSKLRRRKVDAAAVWRRLGLDPEPTP
jgi:MoaA/NifB/PqqE/SkfB family radical SAM enzyme